MLSAECLQDPWEEEKEEEEDPREEEEDDSREEVEEEEDDSWEEEDDDDDPREDVEEEDDDLLGSMDSDVEPPRLEWDDMSDPYSDDDDDNLVDLADLRLANSDEEDEAMTDDEEGETNCPGKKYPREKHAQVARIWFAGLRKEMGEYTKLVEKLVAQGCTNTSNFPPYPLKVFPEVTGLCVARSDCYHRQYRTHDTSTTKSTLRDSEPSLMLQVFSVHLSSSESYPVSVYGIIAVRDDYEPLRNYVFNRPCRNDAVTLDQDSFTLPLCSPCRGMYILDAALVEVDLWVKKEGDGSEDKQSLSAYAEISCDPPYNEKIVGKICSGLLSLNIGFILFTESVEAVIQVFAKVDDSHHLRFAAFSSGSDHEIVLFDDNFSGNKKLFEHSVAVKAQEKLDVCLKLEESLFWWTFQDGDVEAVRKPDDYMLMYGQFNVRVLFAPKKT